MKFFISQPMHGLTSQEIKSIRDKVAEKMFSLNPDAELIDSVFDDVPNETPPLWFLGKSIELLSSADIAIFVSGWEKARGCRIENECCKEYGIDSCTYDIALDEIYANS